MPGMYFQISHFIQQKTLHLHQFNSDKSVVEGKQVSEKNHININNPLNFEIVATNKNWD